MNSLWLSFLAIAGARHMLVSEQETIPAAETFPPLKLRWWQSENRLDVAPVIWSLRNRPEEWRETTRGNLEHMPSQHFIIASRDCYGYRKRQLSAPDCSCQYYSWQRFQLGSLKRAIKDFKNSNPDSADHAWVVTRKTHHQLGETLNEHFRQHFIPR